MITENEHEGKLITMFECGYTYSEWGEDEWDIVHECPDFIEDLERIIEESNSPICYVIQSTLLGFYHSTKDNGWCSHIHMATWYKDKELAEHVSKYLERGEIIEFNKDEL